MTDRRETAVGASDLARAQSWLRAALSDDSLELRFSVDWGASAPGGRARLRAAIAESIGRPGDRDVLDLSRPPAFADGFASVSHGPLGGGFAFSRSRPLGFDLEPLERVREAAALRLARSEDELRQAPSPAALWCAKEAAFKALYVPGPQPTTASSMAIAGWRSATDANASESARLCYAVPASGSPPTAAARELDGATWTIGPIQFALFTLRAP